jgi:hypothetical protein
MNLQIEFTDKQISPWGGMILMKKFMDKCNIGKTIEELPLPQPGSNRGYKPRQIIEGFLLNVWCGGNKFDHTEVIRHDHVLQEIFGWKKLPAADAYRRFFKKFTQGINDRVFTELYKWFFNNLIFDNFILDFDSSVMTRYGDQEGAARGYNPQKPGRKSHHPLMAFVSDCRMVANAWLRPGNTAATSNFFNFLEDTLAKLAGKKIGLLRGDSGFYGDNIFRYLENREQPINYVISAKMHKPLKQLIISQKTWKCVDRGIWICDAEYKAYGWKKARRIIIIRQDTKVRPKATGKQIETLFEEYSDNHYRYSCYATNLNLPAIEVWHIYKNRAEAENRIKELKYDFGYDSFCLQDFFATEAAMNFAMFAYNLMSLFRHAVLNSPVHNRMATLRYKLFAIGSYIITDGNQKILKLSLAMKRRCWFQGLWNFSNKFAYPVDY